METSNAPKPRADSEATLVNAPSGRATGGRNTSINPVDAPTVLPVSHAFRGGFFQNTSEAARFRPAGAVLGCPPGCCGSPVPVPRNPHSDTAQQYQAARRAEDIRNALLTHEDRQLVTPDKMRWIYLDSTNHPQGPWSGIEMHYWYKKGYLPPQLMIKKVEGLDSTIEFEPLSRLIRHLRNSEEPFLMPQIGIPHDTAEEGNTSATNALPLTRENLAIFTGPPKPPSIPRFRRPSPPARVQNMPFKLPKAVVARLVMDQTDLAGNSDASNETSARDPAPLPQQNATYLETPTPGYSFGPNGRIRAESGANLGRPTTTKAPQDPKIPHRSVGINPFGSPIKISRPRRNALTGPSFRADVADTSSRKGQAFLETLGYWYGQDGPLGFVMRPFSKSSAGSSRCQATVDESVKQTKSHVQQTGESHDNTRQQPRVPELDGFLARLTRMPPPVSGLRHDLGAGNVHMDPPVSDSPRRPAEMAIGHLGDPVPNTRNHKRHQEGDGANNAEQVPSDTAHQVPTPFRSKSNPSSAPLYTILNEAEKMKILDSRAEFIAILKKEVQNRDESIELLRKQLKNRDESVELLHRELENRDELVKVLEAKVGLNSTKAVHRNLEATVEDCGE